MPSWQGKLINKIIHFTSRISKPHSDFDIVEHRRSMEKIAGYFKYRKGIIHESFTLNDFSAEWLYFKNYKETVILYLHGGAFVIGSTTTHRGIMSQIAHLTSSRILGINYRLAPEHPFPAALEDSFAAYQWLLQQGISAKKIIIVGDSSGANLAIALSLLLHEKQRPLPAALACLSPWVDLTLSGKSIRTNAGKDPMLTSELGELAINAYLSNQSPELPLVSPLLGDLTHLPPLYIQASTTELLLSDSTRLADKAKLAGVDVTLKIYEEMVHSWQFAYRILPEAKKALNDLAEFIVSIRTRDY